ncbi:MAG: PilN domain-containing protein [Anaerolineae bacterium]|nr:PilN domain-containing protein [Anaerolineae bacterium]
MSSIPLSPTNIEPAPDTQDLPNGAETTATPTRKRRTGLTIMLIVIALGTLLFAQLALGTTMEQDGQALQTQAAGLAATLTATPTVDPEEAALFKELQDIRAQAEALGNLQGTFTAAYVNWPAVMATLGGYDPNQMMLTALAQNGSSIQIQGRANSEAVVMLYADALRGTSLFSRVTVQTISIRNYPTPTSAPDAATMVATGTLEVRKYAEFSVLVDLKGQSQ